MDYRDAVGRGRHNYINKSFARIKRIFTHVIFPGGQAQLFVQGAWYANEGKCPISGTELVSPAPNHHFTHQNKFTPLNRCYQQPVALWPYDPKGQLPPGDVRKTYFDVIDQNEEQLAE
jgi:hypothetical protein